jgi:hypothetical protein
MFYKARVVAVHSEVPAVDIVILDDGRRFSGVQILSQHASGDTGSVNIPTPSVTNSKDPFSSQNTGQRDMFCLVTFVSRDIPVVVGFLPPKVSQMQFSVNNFNIERHASDVYSSISENGDIEMHHPSGTYLKIGTSSVHTDLTGTDYNGKWKLKNNLNTLPNVCVQVANINGVQATINIGPTGNITINNAGATAITTFGTTAITSTGEVTITAPNIVLDSTVHIKKAVTVDADVVALGISSIHHLHADPEGGNTGQPV